MYSARHRLRNSRRVRLRTLKGFAHLLRLNLHENHLGPVGGTTIASTVYSCISLQHLDLGNNRLLDEGALAVAAALSDCPELTYLDLSPWAAAAAAR